MYFPTNTTKTLTTELGLPHEGLNKVLHLCPSPHRSLFAVLTVSGLTVWRVRPSAPLAHLTRTPLSLQDHGENMAAQWSPDAATIVIQTTNAHFILVRVQYSLAPEPYQVHIRHPHFIPGPGEAIPLQRISLELEGVIRIDGELINMSARDAYILYSTRDPTTVQRMSWPSGSAERTTVDDSTPRFIGHETWNIDRQDLPWLIDSEVVLRNIIYSNIDGAEVWITSDGRAYFVQLDADEQGGLGIPNNPHIMPSWRGMIISSPTIPETPEYPLTHIATCSSINAMFSLIALGIDNDVIEVVDYPTPNRPRSQAHVFKPPDSSFRTHKGNISSLEWSTDGCVIVVGWEHGWALWSVGGRSLVWAFLEDHNAQSTPLQDFFMHGISDLFWAPENVELVVLSNCHEKVGDYDNLFIIPFAKSAAVGQQSPDNTRYALLELDDFVMVYRGADQPDMSVINPESDVWQSIKVPPAYMANNWPIKYTAISSDGRLMAVAGRRGFAHYSSASGRWKTFKEQVQEQAFTVTGGMAWFHHVLVVALDVSGSSQVRLYSRDLELTTQSVLFREILSAPVILLSLVDNSLLIYTVDNVLLHYLIVPTDNAIKLHLCGSINFEGVIAFPKAVRCLSWMIPNAQKQFGDPIMDLSVATILMLVGGRLVLLRPRKSGQQEVKYDMQILADRMEFCWIHLRGIGPLENSLWGYDGRRVRVWVDALTIEATAVHESSGVFKAVNESVSFSLDFYPLSALMDKGIILGVDAEFVTRPSVTFVQFRIVTSTHLFLQHMLHYYLEKSRIDQAVRFAINYQDLAFFSHALEVLLHSVLEDDSQSNNSEVDSHTDSNGLLRATIEFLDHFEHALDVIVGCARKTEMARWRRLFSIVGDPKSLFELCLTKGKLKTAGSYLLVLHNLEQLGDGNAEAILLLQTALEQKDWQLCRELLRFLKSIDATGAALNDALDVTGLTEEPLQMDSPELSVREPI